MYNTSTVSSASVKVVNKIKFEFSKKKNIAQSKKLTKMERSRKTHEN